jgi:DNA-binding MarR family transcriptional regulator
MRTERPKPASTPCLCNALRQASRAVSRLYDEELRGVGLRTTQFSLLRRLRSAGKVRQRDLGGLTSLDETTLTRNLRPLIDAGWVAVRPGEDRREKLVLNSDKYPSPAAAIILPR